MSLYMSGRTVDLSKEKIRIIGTRTPYQDMNIVAFNQMYEIVKQNTLLKEFTFSNYIMDNENTPIIGKLINEHPNLSVLNLTDLIINEDQFNSHLLNPISMHPNLSTINLKCSLGTLYSSTEQILKGLKQSKSLKVLNLGFNILLPSGIAAIVELLKENTNLYELNIQGNYFTDDTFDPIIEALRLNKSLSSLNIRYSDVENANVQTITHKSVEKLFEILKYENTSLTTFIRENNICSPDIEMCLDILLLNARHAISNMKVRDFECVRIMGKGCFGTTFLAFEGGKPVALKQLELATPEVVAETEHEVRVMKLLQHNNLVEMFDYFTNDKYFYISMALSQAGDMESIMKGESWDLYAARGMPDSGNLAKRSRLFIRWMRELCDGMSFLHKSHIVHLDMKPANIFLTSKNLYETHLTIGDFGISNRTGEKTYVTTEFGTPEYVAPEVWLGDQFKYEPDIFALGIIFQEILLRKKPFTLKEDIDELIEQITEKKFDPTELEKLRVPPISQLVEKMLNKDRKKRIKIDDVSREINILDFNGLHQGGELVDEDYSLYHPDSLWMTVFMGLAQYPMQIIDEWAGGFGRLNILDQIYNKVDYAIFRRAENNQEFEAHLISHLNASALRNHPGIMKPHLSAVLIKNESIKPTTYGGKAYFRYEDAKEQISHIIEIKRASKKQISNIQILRWLIDIVNTLKYAHDNGFSHSNLSSDMVFTSLSSAHHVKLLGFQTPLRRFRTYQRVTKRMGDAIKDNMANMRATVYDEATLNQILGQLEVQLKSMGEYANQPMEFSTDVQYPLPLLTKDMLFLDVQGIARIWLETYLLIRLQPQQNLLDYLTKMPQQWRNHLKRMLHKGAFTDLSQILVILHDLAIAEIDPDFLNPGEEKMYKEEGKVGHVEPGDEVTMQITPIGKGKSVGHVEPGDEVTMQITPIGKGKSEDIDPGDEVTMPLPVVGGRNKGKRVAKETNHLSLGQSTLKATLIGYYI